MIAAYAIAAVWLAAGWLAWRKSPRTARFWAATALLVLACATVVDILYRPGPWWPLIDRGFDIAEWSVAALWIAALTLVCWRPQHGHRWGHVIMASGAALFMLGLIIAATGHTRHSGVSCIGQSTPIGPWTANLASLKPVAGEGHTGIEASLSLRSGTAPPTEVLPEYRSLLTGGSDLHTGSDILRSFEGELLVEAMVVPANPDCIGIVLQWRPLPQMMRVGAVLALIGAVVLSTLVTLGAWRRETARERIAMRREDRAGYPMPLRPDGPSWRPLAAALLLGLAMLGWQQWQRDVPNRRSPAVPADGDAMIAARQAVFPGPLNGNRWLVIGDAMMRRGQYGNAAQLFQGAIEQESENAEAWLALGDALYGHAGSLGDAAALAYVRADRAHARNGKPGSPVAEALARSGRGEQASNWLHWSHHADSVQFSQSERKKP